jgi:hypothetical protein
VVPKKIRGGTTSYILEVNSGVVEVAESLNFQQLLLIRYQHGIPSCSFFNFDLSGSFF